MWLLFVKDRSVNPLQLLLTKVLRFHRHLNLQKLTKPLIIKSRIDQDASKLICKNKSKHQLGTINDWTPKTNQPVWIQRMQWRLEELLQRGRIRLTLRDPAFHSQLNNHVSSSQILTRLWPNKHRKTNSSHFSRLYNKIIKRGSCSTNYPMIWGGWAQWIRQLSLRMWPQLPRWCNGRIANWVSHSACNSSRSTTRWTSFHRRGRLSTCSLQSPMPSADGLFRHIWRETRHGLVRIGARVEKTLSQRMMQCQHFRVVVSWGPVMLTERVVSRFQKQFCLKYWVTGRIFTRTLIGSSCFGLYSANSASRACTEERSGERCSSTQRSIVVWGTFQTLNSIIHSRMTRWTRDMDSEVVRNLVKSWCQTRRRYLTSCAHTET